jgi:hypothetical protein
MRPTGLKLARRPEVKMAGDDDYWRHPQDPMDQEDGDLEEAGLEYGGEEPGAEEMEAPDIAGFQQAVEEDRSQRGEMSEEEFDAWDMEWRKRGKQAGLDEQEVDALMDSIWEGEGSEPKGYYD